MKINSSTKEYEVNIYNDFLVIDNLEIDEKVFFVIDRKLYDLYKTNIFNRIDDEKLFLVDAIEENKTVETALRICEILTSLSAKRNIRLISFGGGIIQDITGFVANVLYRGIHWTFFPTTLLASCDSCIGGKTSLNYKNYKNLLGTFYPPDQINICMPFFNTLSERDFKSGLGEVVKFNVMQREKGVLNIEKNIDAILERNFNILSKFVEKSLEFKKKFIEKDEFDKGVRIQLNFAHTFGHAFETVSKYQIPHGTAVAMGTIVANRISLARNWVSSDIVERIEKVLEKIIPVTRNEISLDIESILSAIHKDKKQVSSDITAVLIKGNKMNLKIVHDVTQEEIKTGVNRLHELGLL